MDYPSLLNSCFYEVQVRGFALHFGEFFQKTLTPKHLRATG
jgi:hypothetical protein